jgi:phosphatidylglycerol lysyltransferase
MVIRTRPHLVHRIMAALVTAGGVFDLMDGLWLRHPLRLNPIAELLPLEVHQGSRALLVLSGFVLISLGRGLGRGKRRAWQMALAVSSFSVLLHLVRNRHVIFILPPLILLVYLVVARRFFIAGSDPVGTRRSLTLAPVLFLSLLAYGTFGQFRLRSALSPPFELKQALTATLLAAVGADDLGVTPRTPHAREFLDSIAWLSIGATLLILWLLLRPVILRRLDPSFAPAQTIIRAFGDHSLAAFAVEPDKHHFLAANGTTTVAYRVTTGVAITVGDPIGPPGKLEAAVDEFQAHCRRHDWIPCFYEVQAQDLEIYRQRKLRVLKIAEEAIIYLDQFSLHGSKMQKVRQALNKIEREHPHIHVEFFHGSPPEDVEDQLHVISDDWLSKKGLMELGFTMGRFDPATLGGQFLALAAENGKVLAFVSWRPYAGKGLTLDLMRYVPEAPKFIMDFLISKSLLHLQQEGYRQASLANAPLANVTPEDELTMLDRGVRLLFENLHGIYEYKSLFQFKKKFNPTWEGRYLAFPSLETLPRIAVAIMRVHRIRPIEQTLLYGS